MPLMQEVCGSWAGRKLLVAVPPGEGVVVLGWVVLGQCETGKHEMRTNGDKVILWMMVKRWVTSAILFGDGGRNSKNAARNQKGSRSLGPVNEARAGWEQHDLYDAVSFLVELADCRQSTSGNKAPPMHSRGRSAALLRAPPRGRCGVVPHAGSR